MTDEIELTVVMAALECDRTLESSVRAVTASCVGLRAEILVIAPQTAVRSDVIETHPAVEFRFVAGQPTVPDLWAAGIEQANGRAVALTTAQLVVDPGWARALLGALVLPSAGAGGPLDLMPGTDVTDWAIFYLRYSAFLPLRWPDGPVAGEIAGDNAIYWRDDLQRYQDPGRRGFWEVEFHRYIRAGGRTLRAAPKAIARLGSSYPFGAFVHQRLDHGRHFGHMRARSGNRSRISLVASAPLVPLVLAWRAARRVWPDRLHRRRFAIALPKFLVFAAAWASGEAIGALAGDRDAR